MNSLNAYSFCWLKSLDRETKKEIFALTNDIIQETDTIGFCKVLSRREGMPMLSFLNRELKAEAKHLLVIRRGALLVGHALLSKNKLPNCQHRAEISRVMVHPNHRSYPLLLGGLHQIIKKSEEIRVDSIELDVRAYSSLSRLWQRLGFEIIGENPDYARVGIKTFKGFYMRQSTKGLKERLEKCLEKNANCP